MVFMKIRELSQGYKKDRKRPSFCSVFFELLHNNSKNYLDDVQDPILNVHSISSREIYIFSILVEI